MAKKGKKRKRPAKPRSPALRDFFTSGLSRKSHPHKSKTAYDRRKLNKDLDERGKDPNGNG